METGGDIPVQELNRLFSGPCHFVAGAASLESLPRPSLPEVAFVGRSNVGKSSLLNALTNRNSLARTSATPGCTQQLNFFDLGGQLMLVDLPGYGYAKASKKTVKGWNRLIIDYLRGRVPLQRVMILIDARRGLLDTDQEIMRLLDDIACPYQLVLTKFDTLTGPEQKTVFAAVKAAAASHPAAHPRALTTSARTGDGIVDARLALYYILHPELTEQ